MADSHRIKKAIEGFRDSEAGILFRDYLNSEYQRNFSEASASDSDDKSRINALERNLGLSFAINLFTMLPAQIEDDIIYLEGELK